MDTSDSTKHGFVAPEHAPQAIRTLEARVDELRAAGDGFSAFGVDMSKRASQSALGLLGSAGRGADIGDLLS
ncbi:MAG: hypothetical protein ACLPVY_06665 [Acidimicrobiia bacterium]